MGGPLSVAAERWWERRRVESRASGPPSPPSAGGLSPAQLLPPAVLRCRDLGDLSPCGVDEFGIGIRMTCEPPATLDRLCEQDPRPLCQRRVVRRLADELGELTHHGELLVAIERTSVREHLDAHVIVVSL